MTERINFDMDTILKVGLKSNNRCSKCKSQNNLCIHHITPLSKGGDNKIDNLILLCGFCHKLVHKNKDEIEFYNEDKYYSKELIFKDTNYREEIGWLVDFDGTDHIEFLCPICKTPAIIKKVMLRTYNNLMTPPCFYFLLKCPRCKVNGQRKCYLNYSIDQIKNIKGEENGR